MNAYQPITNLENLHVLTLDNGSNVITEVLGISEERTEELDKLFKNAYIETSNLTTAFVKVSHEIVHANELVYCCFHMGALHDRLMSNHSAAIAAQMEREDIKKQNEVQDNDDYDLVFPEEKAKEEDDLIFDDE